MNDFIIEGLISLISKNRRVKTIIKSIFILRMWQLLDGKLCTFNDVF